MKKQIHYCWFGKNELPEIAKLCINSWKKYFPDYEIIEWNEDNFNINCNDYVKEAYTSKKFAFVSDYARLKIIYENGGIYFDIDVEVIKKFTDDMLENGFFGFENGYINTGLGFSAPKHSKILKLLLDDYESIHFIKPNGTFDLLPCPIRNTKCLKKHNYNLSKKILDNIQVYDDEFFNPYDYQKDVLKITNNTYSIHHCNASWLSKNDQVLLKKKQHYMKKYGHFLGKNIYYIYKIIYLIKIKLDI